MDPRIAPYVSFLDKSRGLGTLGSSQSATRSFTEMEAAHVSAMLRTPGVTSYLSIHWEM